MRLASSNACFALDTQYDPLDMPGQQRSVHKTIEACKRRCTRVAGCAHFSYQADTGGCHLEDKDAQSHRELGITSGPPICGAPTPAPTPVVSDAHQQPCGTVAPTPVKLSAPAFAPAPSPDVVHNSFLVPGLIGGAGVAAAAAAGGGIAAAIAASHHANANGNPAQHPTFPPVGPTGIPGESILRARKQDEPDATSSGIWIIIIVFACALSAILLAGAVWYFCCNRDMKGRRGRFSDYDSVLSDDEAMPELVPFTSIAANTPRMQMPPEAVNSWPAHTMYSQPPMMNYSTPVMAQDYAYALPSQAFYSDQYR